MNQLFQVCVESRKITLFDTDRKMFVDIHHSSTQKIMNFCRIDPIAKWSIETKAKDNGLSSKSFWGCKHGLLKINASIDESIVGAEKCGRCFVPYSTVH